MLKVEYVHRHTFATRAAARIGAVQTAPGPKSARTGLTLYQILDTLQNILRCWTGICTTCHQPLPARTLATPRSRQT